MAGILGTLAEWLVSVSQWFNDWDITILVPALIILTVIAGVTGRAATGPRLWMQLVWGTVTVILGMIEVAIIWTIIARYLPVADMGTLIQNMLQLKPCSSQNKCRGWACVAAMGIVGKSHRHSSVDIGPTSVVCLPSDGAARRMNSPMSGTVKATLPCSGE